MSRYVDLKFAIEAQRRRELYLSRITETTQSYIQKYENLLADIRHEGLKDFIEQDFSQAESELFAISSLILSDPESARDRSRELGGWIGGLPRMARDIRSELEQEKERQRQAANAKFQKLISSIFSSITDPVVRDFAYTQSRELISLAKQADITPENIAELTVVLTREFQAIKKEAEEKAVEWKEKKRRDSTLQATREAIRLQKEVISETSGSVGFEKLTVIMKKLDGIEQMLSMQSASTHIPKALNEIAVEMDNIVVGEECRREAVKAIIASLKQSGFVVETPKLIKDEEGGEVVIKAQRMAGQESIFKVKQNGAMTYKFHKYEGSACKNDIEMILPKLEKVYGIRLSDERVLWENPDRLTAVAKPIDDITSKNMRY